jgi:hypothetical protein
MGRASLAPGAPAHFVTFLCQHLSDLVRPGEVHLIQATDPPGVECRHYSDLLAAAPIGLVCLGIGENGPSPSTTRRWPTSRIRRWSRSRDRRRFAPAAGERWCLRAPGRRADTGHHAEPPRAHVRGAHPCCVVPGARKRGRSVHVARASRLPTAHLLQGRFGLGTLLVDYRSHGHGQGSSFVNQVGNPPERRPDGAGTGTCPMAWRRG